MADGASGLYHRALQCRQRQQDVMKKNLTLWAVVPIKPKGQAKSRLASVLPKSARAALFKAMLHDVLESLNACDAIDGILLVTSVRRGRALARRFNAGLFEDDGTVGLNGALDKAANHLKHKNVDRLLLLHGDLPAIRPQEIQFMLAQHRDTPGMTIAPDLAEQGTNAMIVSPPDLLAFSYGINSFQRHWKAARMLGIEPTTVRLPGTGLDIDEPADLQQLLLQEHAPHTRKMLAKINWTGSIEDPTGDGVVVERRADA